ncbi:MAG: phospholipase D-like domain-containing protein [Opitutaceae bacterium]
MTRKTEQQGGLPRWKRRLRFGIGAAFLLLIVLPYLLPGPTPPTAGFAVRSESFPCPPDRIHLLIDSTSHPPDAEGSVLDHAIFDALLDQIARADDFICADFFLWNPWEGAVRGNHRDLAEELAAALIARKLEDPDLPIVVLTDPINRIYGNDEPEFFAMMAEAGIPVVFTDLTRLADSNFLYARPARFYGPILSTLLTPTGLLDRRWIGNPFDPDLGPISLRQMGHLLYFKANHRKILVTRSAERGIELTAGSLNPANGSAAHSNLAVQLTGPVAQAALGTELSVIRWSAREGTVLEDEPGRLDATVAAILKRTLMDWDDYLVDEATARATWLTESRIREAVVDQLERAGSGDRIEIAMFYLSDRMVIDALKAAVRRDVSIFLILDANRDAFGREKNGIPNRPVAAELMRLGRDHPIEIRWADTRGEQFHPKAMAVIPADGRPPVLLLGSANWTRRNLGDLNLESDLLLENPGPALDEFRRWFAGRWTNAGQPSTVDYDIWAIGGVTRFWKTALYRFQEALGAGTF